LRSASNRYPSHPGFRTGSPETSEEAAIAIAPLARNHRDKVLAFLKTIYPEARSSDQIADAIGLSHYAVRPRTSELFADQKIERTNDRTKNGNGRSVVLWRAAA
jgi:predicted ArsR family transcriptional regulator